MLICAIQYVAVYKMYMKNGKQSVLFSLIVIVNIILIYTLLIRKKCLVAKGTKIDNITVIEKNWLLFMCYENTLFVVIVFHIVYTSSSLWYFIWYFIDLSLIVTSSRSVQTVRIFVLTSKIYSIYWTQWMWKYWPDVKGFNKQDILNVLNSNDVKVFTWCGRFVYYNLIVFLYKLYFVQVLVGFCPKGNRFMSVDWFYIMS